MSFLVPQVDSMTVGTGPLHLERVDLGLALHFSYHASLERFAFCQKEERCQPGCYHRPDHDGDGDPELHMS